MNPQTRGNPTAPRAEHIPLWQRSLPRAGAVAAAFTTLCCLGFTAALSLASAVGATFLTRDATLKPLLVATIILTLVGSALTYRRHGNPLPLILTAPGSSCSPSPSAARRAPSCGLDSRSSSAFKSGTSS